VYPALVTDTCAVPGGGGGGSVTFPDIFNIDAAGGAEIAGAILAIWAIAWAFRMLIRALSIGGNSSTSESE
jgi:hypothetical protein